jgi:hypothetical protein
MSSAVASYQNCPRMHRENSRNTAAIKELFPVKVGEKVVKIHPDASCWVFDPARVDRLCTCSTPHKGAWVWLEGVESVIGKKPIEGIVFPAAHRIEEVAGEVITRSNGKKYRLEEIKGGFKQVKA